MGQDQTPTVRQRSSQFTLVHLRSRRCVAHLSVRAFRFFQRHGPYHFLFSGVRHLASNLDAGKFWMHVRSGGFGRLKTYHYVTRAIAHYSKHEVERCKATRRNLCLSLRRRLVGRAFLAAAQTRAFGLIVQAKLNLL